MLWSQQFNKWHTECYHVTLVTSCEEIGNVCVHVCVSECVDVCECVFAKFEFLTWTKNIKRFVCERSKVQWCIDHVSHKVILNNETLMDPYMQSDRVQYDWCKTQHMNLHPSQRTYLLPDKSPDRGPRGGLTANVRPQTKIVMGSTVQYMLEHLLIWSALSHPII